MKMIIAVALALVAVAAAAPVDEPIPIVKSEFNQQPEGGYDFQFETGNGISRNEQGALKEALDEDNKPRQVITVRGSFSYPDENGKPITITYYADDTGYHAEGDSIPQLSARR